MKMLPIPLPMIRGRVLRTTTGPLSLRLSHPLRHNTTSGNITTNENVLDELSARGMIFCASGTHDDIHNVLGARIPKTSTRHLPPSVYAGFDPTADSLHVGNLLTLIALMHFQRHGHPAIALVGGATGSIGDPSGRTMDRVALPVETVRANTAAIRTQIQGILRNMQEQQAVHSSSRALPTPPITVVNNLDWLQSVTLLDFLRDAGRFARVNEMLARESVQTRLQAQNGITFTEFTYQLLQAYDFAHLYRAHGCRVQLGGSDQWGNILAGTDLIRKWMGGDDAHGVTIPLLTTRNGEKFGKSAGNAVWLDARKTAYFDFYQFFVRTDDADVERLLKFLTFKPLAEIAEIMQEHNKSPESRLAQHHLADSVTQLVHGERGLKRAQTATRVLFGEAAVEQLAPADLVDAFRHDPRLIGMEETEVQGMPVMEMLKRSGACASKNEARRLLQSRGVYINGKPLNDDPLTHCIDVQRDFLGGRVMVVRTGKRNYRLVELSSSSLLSR